MMRVWYLCFSLIFVQWITNCVFGQQDERHFRNISVEKGLSQSTVFSITQDTVGFMWIGTKDGLNRYDGKRFTIYRSSNTNSKSIVSSYISYLYVDKSGQLWVGGDRGISKYNYDTDDFENYPLARTAGEWSVSSIVEDENKNLWASSTGGDIFIFSKTQKKFNSLTIDVSAYGIKRISFISSWQKTIVVGTEVGLFKIDAHKQKLDKIDIGISKPVINCAYIDGDLLLIGTEGSGLVTLHKSKGVTQIERHRPNKNSIADNNVRTIYKDQLGNIWLGTFRGLSIYNPNTKIFQNYFHEVSQPFALSQNSVRCIFQDRQKGMWLGTYYGGVNYYHQKHIKFNLLSRKTGNLSLNDEVVSIIKEDSDGNVWIGTNDRGLNFWNRKKNQISYYSASEGNAMGLNSNNIKSLVFSSNNDVLIGTHNGGLNVLNKATGMVKHYVHNDLDQQSIAGDLVYSLLKDDKGRIWVGTYSGLDQFDPQKGTFKHILLDNARRRLRSDEITYLFQDSKKRIWIGTTSGVTQFYPDNLLFAFLPNSKLADDVINCITEDKKGRIWIGTRRGISLYDESSRAFVTHDTRKDFFKGNIYGIVPDEEGNLWISTNQGLIQFNPDKGTSHSYDEKDGLQSNQFNEYAFCRTSDGMLLFGGIKGISYFYPSWVKQEPIKLQLRFTGLEVFGKNIVAHDQTNILDLPIDQTVEITLGPENKQFSIYFNSFNYLSANRTAYLYKLDGFDTQWQQSEDPKVSYNNVPAGNYTLLVKAKGPNGEESSVKKLEIRIQPLWYKSTWFYLLLLCLVGGLAYLAYRIVSERIRTLQQLKMERLDKEKVRYINQVKMDFFTNVSHELRTPLTLLLGPLEEMVSRAGADKWLKKQHELMLVNARRLYHLVDQLFEFKKTERGTRKLRVHKSDLVSFLKEIYESFSSLAEKNGVQYVFKSEITTLSFFFDKDAVERILFNLLSNAFKYTSSHHRIAVSFSVQDDFARIEVSDTGTGIAHDQLDKVFDRFYQIEGEEANLGSGVGLAFTKRLVELHHGRIYVESELGKGSRFFIELPISDQYYVDAEQKNDEHELVSIPENNELNVADSDGNADIIESKEKQLFKHTKILVVDDNEEILNYLKRFLEDSFDISTAADGQMALKYLETEQFDLVLSDVMMPELDGLHLCKRIKQNINTSHIPVILLTAKSETSQQLKGLEMGADDYITKPFSPALLKAKLFNLLKSRKRLKEYYAENKEIVPENIAFNTLDEEFLKEAVAIIEKHLSNSDFSVEKFSREIGMSRSNLYLKFKAITGESATDFIKRIRFTKAVELMQSQRYTIAQIAYMCGFNSPSYFSTAFKQYYGYMPSEYASRRDA
ncbi:MULTISPECIES: hybrid sensor histidine kinase/response regulator transcription factor [unclassified Sphingobacterium]|uniref:hybrid sensor histidine kinase/response regulator transcription factor n=1 Tax=unclassified Sphingobacterium TaxID=2609468 RepID=UPI0010D9F0DB|nr:MULTISPECIES: hybrid sensor histidine kinase/response regulator transcription factor [unclassified Sphingobacterium]MCS3553807.1 signal transduction histidine kinase/DNA-binding response OmpR family regulator/streptogramin lyase [Sphingobacterium sp. JUb21]TCR05128.1 two component regulator with propeller domain [Sphingobacterium sp. JUb20]